MPSSGILKRMKHNPNVKIVAFVGLTGSGKSSATTYLAEKGFPRVYFGGVVLDAMTEAGLEHTPENEASFREELRAREGKDFIVNRIVSQINDLFEAGQHRVVADGLYTWTEYKILKREFHSQLMTVAIVTPRRLRYRRLGSRAERPLNEQQAATRDWAEIENLEKGGPIAIADHYIINDGNLDRLYQQIDQELEHINFYS